jgi:phenylalanyl-tRNA synthetase beta chain
MPLENEQMCLMVTGLQAAESWYREAREVDAAFLQGHLMDFLAMVAPWSTTNLQVRTVLQGPDTLPDPAVRLGAVDPRILEAFDIRQPVFAAFLDWTALASPPSSPPAAFEEVPKFPSIRRDLALVAPEGTLWADLEKIALRHGGPSLESLCLFDVYRGKGLPEGTVSYGVGLVFRHRDRTLNYAEIEANIEAMLVTFEKSLAVRLRR